jgi:uncharacterized SAM-binding protein YcdF (DUF218 family)
MFFYASKLLYALVQPSTLVLLAIFVGSALVLARRHELLGRRLLATGLVLVFVLGISPVSFWLLLPLEERFPRPTLPEHVAGIIVLGGFEDIDISLARGALAINDNAERLTEGLLLARERPDARLIFTGGNGSLVPTDTSAAGSIAAFYRDAGIAPGRLVMEGKSRTTYENAVYLRETLCPKPTEHYVLVTSAFHMPRSVGTFRQQGFDVVPWPVDYRTEGMSDALAFTSKFTSGLSRLDFVVKEWIGLLAYYASGRSDSLWPGPLIQSEPGGRSSARSAGR